MPDQPNSTDSTSTPAPAATPTPAQIKAQKAFDEATLPDSGFDEELDALPPSRAAAVSAAAVPPVPDATPEPPKHSARSIRLAKEFGLSQQQIDAATPAELEEELYARNMEVLGALRARMSEPRTPPQTPAAPAPDDEFDLKMTAEEEAEWDPKHLKVLKKSLEAAKRVKQLETQLNEQKQEELGRQASARIEAYDTAFATREDVFGKGAVTEVDPQSTEYQRRVAIGRMVESDTSHLSLAKKIDKAIKVMYGDTAPATKKAAEVDAKVEANKNRFKNGTVAKPTHRASRDLPKGEERALKTLSEKFHENGWTDDSFEGIEEKNLPD